MRIRCSACSALLNVADQVAGKRIRCPRCKEATVAEPAAAEEQRPQSKLAIHAASPSAKPRPPVAKTTEGRRNAADDDEETPRLRKKKKKRKKDRSSLIVGIAVAGGAALCIAITAAVLVLVKPRASAAPEAPAVAEGAGLQPDAAIVPQKSEPSTPPRHEFPKFEPMKPAAQPRLKIGVVPSYFKVPEASEEIWLAQGREDLNQMHRTLRDAYDKVGRHDPKWDKVARLALEFAAGMFAEKQDRAERANDVYDPVCKAISLGCDDPMILYFHARTYGGKDRNLKESEITARHVKAAEALRDSKYSPFRRSVALRLAAYLLWNTKAAEPREQSKKMLADALDAFVLSMKEERGDPAIRRQLLAEGRDFVRLCTLTEGNSLAGWKKVDGALAKVPDSEAFRLKLQGGFLTGYAWEARGGGSAATLTDNGARLFRDRLEEARGCFERAWQLDPTDTYIPIRMITVARGLGAQKEEVRKWFDRAMKLDPGCVEACEEVLSYLDPRWYGSMEKVLAFGRECGKSKLVGSHIPLLVLRGHLQAVSTLEPSAVVEYMTSEAVWNEIMEPFDRNFQAYPDDIYPSACLALFCGSAPGKELIAFNYLSATGHNWTPVRRAMMEFPPQSERGLVYRYCPSK